mgnify:CR=1 FL=1
MKNIISIALVLVLAASLMTGCRGGSQGESTNGDTQNTGDTSPSLPVTTPTEASVPDLTIPDMTDIMPGGGEGGQGGQGGSEGGQGGSEGGQGGMGGEGSQGGMPGQGDVGRGRSIARY